MENKNLNKRLEMNLINKHLKYNDSIRRIVDVKEDRLIVQIDNLNSIRWDADTKWKIPFTKEQIEKLEKDGEVEANGNHYFVF